MRRLSIQSGPSGDRKLAVPEAQPGLSASRAAASLAADPAVIVCPRCRQRVPVAGGTCPACGFPFICDVGEIETPAQIRRGQIWRVLLGLAAIIFLLTSGVFMQTGYDEYQGLTTAAVASTPPATDSGIPIDGPPLFVSRTELALGLLKLRAPDFYWRMQDSVTSIEYLGPAWLEGPEGRRISLENIGALAEPATGRVRVLYTTVFPSGMADLWDRDAFSYAGVLVHELRHIELHAMGRAPGGWEEEVLCEQAAYAALQQAQAPPAVLLRYEIYLDDPQARRYQHWYDWYQQWE
ncbi:hypothetical protein JW859_14155 [bacterium]|nr:hypothetical protein [bacterium]